MKKWLISLFTVIFVLSFMQVDNVQAQTFRDVDESKEYYLAVEQLVELGSFSKAEQFNPNQEVTRGQLAKILAQALQLDTKNVEDPKFKDVPQTSPFYPYIAALVQQNIVSGYSDGTYGVNNKVTRGQMAKFIVNGFQLPIAKQRYRSYDDEIKSTDVLQNANTLVFYEISVAENFNPNGKVTRSQIALFISRAIKVKERMANVLVVPYTTFTNGEQVTNFGKLYFASTRDWIVDAKINEVTGEFYIIPYQKGASGFSVAVNGKNAKLYNFDVAEDLSIKYVEELDEFEAPYNWVHPMIYFGENIKEGTFIRIAGGEKLEDSISIDDYKDKKSLMDIYSYQELPGELWRVDVEFLDGGKDVAYYYSYAGVDGDADFPEEIVLTTDSAVYIDELQIFEGDTVAVVEGDASAVELVNIEGDIYISIAKTGYYVISVEDEDWIYEIGITVFEIDGKIGYVFGQLKL